MNLHNIVSAGRMMSIVVALLGAFHCGAAFAMKPATLAWDIALGIAVVACGLVLVVMIPLAERRRGIATAVLVIGTLLAFLGVATVSLDWPDPFSWMLAIVGLAIFIDTLCLKIQLRIRN